MDNEKYIIGSGFEISRKTLSEEKLREFIVSHEETICKLPEGRRLIDYAKIYPLLISDVRYEFTDWVNDHNNYCGIEGMIADVMSKETGINFEYIESLSDDANDAIIFSNEIPWNVNHQDITDEKLEEICNQYINELDGKTEFKKHIKIEYMQ